MIPRFGVLLLVCLLVVCPGRGQQHGPKNAPITLQRADRELLIDDNFGENTLLGYLYLYSTANAGLTVQNVSDTASRMVNFRLLNQEIPTLGMDNRHHWVRLRVRNGSLTAHNLILGLDFFDVNDLSLYILDEHNRLVGQYEHLSRYTTLAHKPIPVRQYAFPVDIKPNQRLTLYCKVHRTHSLILLPFKLFDKEAFYASRFLSDFFIYSLLGVFGFISLSSILLFGITRQRLLLHYAGYTICAGLFFASLEGIILLHSQVRIPFLGENTNAFLSGLTLYFELLFTIEFLRLSVDWPKWVANALRWYAGIVLIVSLYVLVMPFRGVQVSVISVFNFLGILLITALILRGTLRRQYESGIYLLAITPFFGSMVWFALTTVFELERTWLFYQLSYVAPFFEVIVLCVGIGYKLISERERYVIRVSELQNQSMAAIIDAQETERQRIATDLHDDLGGTLATIRQRLTNMSQHTTDAITQRAFADLEPLIQKSGHDLRRIAHNLMPPEFERLGLSGAVEQLIASQPAQPTRFSFITAGIEQKLPLDIELNAYRIVSELIQNIVKHAQASRGAVQLLYQTDYLSILVDDDGLGSRAVASVDTPIGIGLKNSNLRAEYMGATLRRDVSEAGTLVVLNVPYPPRPDAPQSPHPYHSD